LSVSFTAVLVLKHSCSGYSTIVPEHSWMQDVLAQLGLAGYNQELDLSCIPCLSYSNKQPRTVIPKTPNSVIPTKLLVGILVLLLHDFDQERRTDPCSGTKNRFFIWRTGNHSPVNQFLLNFRTPNHGFSKAQILNRSSSG